MASEHKRSGWRTWWIWPLAALPAIAVGVLIALWVRGPSLSPQEAKIIAIARQAVAANDDWLDRAEFETPEKNCDGTWTVLVWRKPATPGGHRFIRINDEGTVVEYGRGL